MVSDNLCSRVIGCMCADPVCQCACSVQWVEHVVEDQQFCIAASIRQSTHHLTARSSSSEILVHADTGGA